MKDKKLLTKAQIEAVEIDDFNIHDEMVNFPGDLAYWNAKYSRATEVYLLEKHEFEITRSRLYLEHKEEAAAKKGKAPTVEDLKALLFTDDEYQEAHMAFIDAEIEREKCRRFAEAIVAKGDMLRSLGAKLREEMKSDPSVRSEHEFESHRKKEGI